MSYIRSRGGTPASLFADGTKVLGGSEIFILLFQLGKVFFVEIDHSQQFGFAAGTVRGRRYETLCIEQVAIHQEVSYRLVVVGVGSSDVGTDENTGLFRNRLLGKNSRRTENT